jgi:hypothetical protein
MEGNARITVRSNYVGLPARAGRGADEGRRKLPGSGRAEPSHPRPEVTVPGTEKPPVARRKAPRAGNGART